jgi:hypothetical protein
MRPELLNSLGEFSRTGDMKRSSLSPLTAKIPKEPKRYSRTFELIGIAMSSREGLPAQRFHQSSLSFRRLMVFEEQKFANKRCLWSLNEFHAISAGTGTARMWLRALGNISTSFAARLVSLESCFGSKVRFSGL